MAKKWEEVSGFKQLNREEQARIKDAYEHRPKDGKRGTRCDKEDFAAGWIAALEAYGLKVVPSFLRAP